MENVFEADRMSKRERVLATLNRQPVDRAARPEQQPPKGLGKGMPLHPPADLLALDVHIKAA